MKEKIKIYSPEELQEFHVDHVDLWSTRHIDTKLNINDVSLHIGNEDGLQIKTEKKKLNP